MVFHTVLLPLMRAADQLTENLVKFGDAKIIPFVSISADSGKFADAPATHKAIVRQQTHVENEFETQAELLRRDITSFVAEGQNIRAEVEGLIVWRRYMGEGSGSSTWGPIQQAHAAQWIEVQRARLAKLKSSIETDRKNAAEILEYIFGDKTRGNYDASVTRQARQELGLDQ
jgi:hypothetical protein